MFQYFAVQIKINNNLPNLAVVEAPTDTSHELVAKVALAEIGWAYEPADSVTTDVEVVSKQEYNVLLRFTDVSPSVTKDDLLDYQ